MAPVYVNGEGPFSFVVDTGASHSAIAPRLAQQLELEADPGRMVKLRGVTGAANVPSMRVASLQVGEITFRDLQLPVVQPGIFAEADGILGVEGLAGTCLQADFYRQTLEIAHQRCPRARSGWLRVRADPRASGLLTVKGQIRSVRVRIIIDTGAERSLGNPALLRALHLERDLPIGTPDTQVLGATAHAATGRTLATPTIEMGGVTIDSAMVTYGDFEVFALWGLDGGPAMLLGMDVLGTTDALMVDYRRREVFILPSGSRFLTSASARSRVRSRLN